MSKSLSGLYDLKESAAVADVATVPPAVTNDSPTDELTDANELAKTDWKRAEDIKIKRAANLLSLTFNKLDKLIHLKRQDFAEFDSLQYFTENYYKAMGFGSKIETSQYKDDIGNVKIYDMVKKFIDKITYEGTLNTPTTFTLHDVIGRWVRVDKSNPKTNSSDPSDYCKARNIFIKILEFIKKNVPPLSWATFSYSSSGGLLESSKTCTPLAGRDVTNPLRSIDPKRTKSIIETNLTDVVLLGGVKSRRIRRRKHNRKTHRKHARKTHHKRASKSHKRRRHSRVVRKHKKHTRR